MLKRSDPRPKPGRPPADEHAERIHDGQEALAVAGEQLGRVAHPLLVRGCRLELPVEDVGGHGLVVVAHGGALEPLARTRLELFLAHEPTDPLLAHVNVVRRRQLLLDARSAVPLAAQFVCFADEDSESQVIDCMG
jgi:hypothetical protein